MTTFENWFSSDWRKMLHGAQCEGEALSCFRIADASWDRRAGYLMWVQLGRPKAAWQTIYPIEQQKDHTVHLPPRFEPAPDDDLLALPSDPDIEDLLAL